MPILAALYFSAAPAGAAYVLGPKACNDPYRSGQSLYLSQRSYLHRDAQLAKLARQRFGIDESAALGTLRERYPGLGLETLRTRVIVPLRPLRRQISERLNQSGQAFLTSSGDYKRTDTNRLRSQVEKEFIDPRALAPRIYSAV